MSGIPPTKSSFASKFNISIEKALKWLSSAPTWGRQKFPRKAKGIDSQWNSIRKYAGGARRAMGMLWGFKYYKAWAMGARAPGVFSDWISLRVYSFAFLGNFCLPQVGAERSTLCFFIIDLFHFRHWVITHRPWNMNCMGYFSRRVRLCTCCR